MTDSLSVSPGRVTTRTDATTLRWLLLTPDRCRASVAGRDTADLHYSVDLSACFSEAAVKNNDKTDFCPEEIMSREVELG